MKTALLTTLSLLCFTLIAEEHDHAHDHEAATPHVEAEHDHAHDHELEEALALELPEATQRLIGLKTTAVEQRQLHASIPLRGRFERDPDTLQALTAPIAGRITLKRKRFDTVGVGDELFTITAPELQMRANEINLLQQRLATYQAAKIAHAELESQLKLKLGEWQALVGDTEVNNGTLSVKSPVAGTLSQWSMPNGAWCEMGDQILQLTPQAPLRFKALLPPAEAQQLTHGMTVHYGAQQGSLRIGLTSESGLTPLYVSFATPPEDAMDGRYAVMECHLHSSETPVTAIPKQAIVRIGVQPTVFIRDPHHPNRFVACSVTLGIAHQGWVAIAGLPCGTKEVVTQGQYELKLALPSANPQEPVGHYHADGSFHQGEH